MIKVLTIGGATLDTIIEYEKMLTMSMQRKNNTESFMLLEEGSKIEVREHNSFSGGGATNASVSMKKQGIDVSFFGKVGRDIAGDKILQELKSLDVNISNVRFSKKYGTATSYVIPTLSGDRTIFAYRGANRDILDDDLPCQAIIESDFIYITSLSRSSAARLPKIVEIAKDNNIPVAINPGYSQLEVGESFIKESMFGIDILVLNYQEATKLMMSLISTDTNNVVNTTHTDNIKNSNDAVFQDSTFKLADFFKLCLSLGPRIITVTDGKNGIYVATKDKLYHSKALDISNVVNTLGAGDAFSSTFCANIYKDSSIEDAIKYSLVNASQVIQHPDAKSGLLNSDELQKHKKELDGNPTINITSSFW